MALSSCKLRSVSHHSPFRHLYPLPQLSWPPKSWFKTSNPSPRPSSRFFPSASVKQNTANKSHRIPSILIFRIILYRRCALWLVKPYVIRSASKQLRTYICSYSSKRPWFTHLQALPWKSLYTSQPWIWVVLKRIRAEVLHASKSSSFWCLHRSQLCTMHLWKAVSHSVRLLWHVP